MTLIELEIEMMKASKAILLEGDIYAEAKSTYEQLIDFKDPVKFAQYTFKGSIALQEAIAKTSQTYQTHLTGIGEARRAFEKAKVRFIHAQSYFEALRTQISNKKVLIEKGIDHA